MYIYIHIYTLAHTHTHIDTHTHIHIHTHTHTFGSYSENMFSKYIIGSMYVLQTVKPGLFTNKDMKKKVMLYILSKSALLKVIL